MVTPGAAKLKIDPSEFVLLTPLVRFGPLGMERVARGFDTQAFSLGCRV
jgi:hypothetical protein